MNVLFSRLKLVLLLFFCIIYPSQSFALIAIQPAHSGVWFNPLQDGHGFFLTVDTLQEKPKLVISWYHYDQGEQRYVVGGSQMKNKADS